MILGIDPGLSGAVAAYGLCLGGATLEVFDLPTTERVVNGKTKRQLDLHALANDLRCFPLSLVKFAIIEQVSAMPGQGVTSSFNFGFTAGAIQGVVAALGIPIRTVSPQVWKRKFGLLGQPKDASRAEASRRFPQYADQWPLKKHDGRAEAALLALYGTMMDNQP